MKKVILALSVSIAMFASGEYIWWMIRDSGSVGDWTVAKVFADNGGGNHPLNIYLPQDDYAAGDSVGTEVSLTQYGDYLDGYGLYADISDYYVDGWSYYVELYNQDVLVGTSDKLLYADAGQYLNPDGSAVSIPSTSWTIASFSVPVPEPTSGMMILIGASLLALRRKRRV